MQEELKPLQWEDAAKTMGHDIDDPQFNREHVADYMAAEIDAWRELWNRRTPVSGEVTEDFVLVPRKPTPEMLNALYVTPDFVGSTIIRHSVDKLPAAYDAMLAAWQARGQQAGGAEE